MNSLKRPSSRVAAAGLALSVLQLAACASVAPKSAPPPAAAPPPPPAPPPVVTMAPIPNPTEAPTVQRHGSSHSHATSSELKREHERAREAEHERSAPAAAASPLAPPTRDPAKAARLRARGLEELDRGAVTRAIALLTEASQLDPSNALIHRDLDRAERIARAVHGSK